MLERQETREIRKFTEFYGNETVKLQLKHFLKSVYSGKTSKSAFLFAGDSGCGKTTLARLMSYKVGANSQSIYEYNVANTRGIDTIREIIESSKSTHLTGAVKCFILDEAHRLTIDAQEALLKVLESGNAYFFICTTVPNRLIDTVRNRCFFVRVERLSAYDAEELLQKTIEKHGFSVSDDVVKEIIAVSKGVPRALLMNLFQCHGLTLSEAKKILKVTGIEVESDIAILCRLLDSDKASWSDITKEIERLLHKHSSNEIVNKLIAYYLAILKNSKIIRRGIMTRLDLLFNYNSNLHNDYIYYVIAKLIDGGYE